MRKSINIYIYIYIYIYKSINFNILQSKAINNEAIMMTTDVFLLTRRILLLLNKTY